MKFFGRPFSTRRDAFITALKKVGWDVPIPRATMYLWARLPKAAKKMGSLKFAERLILEQGLVIAPGVGFGPHGEGYMRMSLIAPDRPSVSGSVDKSGSAYWRRIASAASPWRVPLA